MTQANKLPNRTKKRALKPQSKKITPETDLFTQFCATQLHVECVREYRFYKPRMWRFDYALPEYKIAIEVEGGIWTRGRHTRPVGFINDMTKYNTATLCGWRVFRTTPSKLLSDEFTSLIRSAV